MKVICDKYVVLQKWGYFKVFEPNTISYLQWVSKHGFQILMITFYLLEKIKVLYICINNGWII